MNPTQIKQSLEGSYRNTNPTENLHALSEHYHSCVTTATQYTVQTRLDFILCFLREILLWQV